MDTNYEIRPLRGKTYYMTGFTNVGIYKLSDTEVCLIDSGNCEDSARALVDALQKRGWTAKLIINTHAHADHIAGNAMAQAVMGAKCYCAGMEQLFASHTELESQFINGAAPFDALETWVYLAPQGTCEVLTDDVLPEGFETASLRGHSPDQIGIKTPDGVWFVGDTVVSLQELEHYHLTYIADLDGYLKSLEHVKTLTGELFVPSHNPPVADITPLAGANRRQVEDNAALILELCREPLSQEQLQVACFRRWGRRMSVPQYILTGSILRTYLAWLHTAGKIDYLIDDLMVKWQTKQ